MRVCTRVYAEGGDLVPALHTAQAGLSDLEFQI